MSLRSLDIIMEEEIKEVEGNLIQWYRGPQLRSLGKRQQLLQAYVDRKSNRGYEHGHKDGLKAANEEAKENLHPSYSFTSGTFDKFVLEYWPQASRLMEYLAISKSPSPAATLKEVIDTELKVKDAINKGVAQGIRARVPHLFRVWNPDEREIAEGIVALEVIKYCEGAGKAFNEISLHRGYSSGYSGVTPASQKAYALATATGELCLSSLRTAEQQRKERAG